MSHRKIFLLWRGLYHSARIKDLYYFFLVLSEKEMPSFIEYKKDLRRALQQNHVSFCCFKKSSFFLLKNVLNRPKTFLHSTRQKFSQRKQQNHFHIFKCAFFKVLPQYKNSSRVHFDEKQYFFLTIYCRYLGF